MEHIQPLFYDQFQCIAGQCSDTCCAGWEVYIDPVSLAQYQADHSIFGLYRQSQIIKSQDGALFALDQNRRCVFLNEENLCTMILEDGEDSLCHICAHHPRFYKEYGCYDEQGIGLCCPEGSRLLLSQPLGFRRSHSPCTTGSDPMAQTLFELRELLQEVLLDASIPFPSRCQEALAIAQQAQSQLYGDSISPSQVPPNQLHLWQSLLEEMMALLPINQAWQTYLEALTAQLPTLVENHALFLQSTAYDDDQYGNIAAYILYRHFPDALWDGAILPRLTFALLSTLFVHICYLSAWTQQGTLTLDDKVHHLKNWSKQVEYCDENTQQFLQACQQNPAFVNGL